MKLFDLPIAARYREFRKFLLGEVASIAGFQMLTGLSLGWLIFELTNHDARYIGYMTACIAAPGAGISLLGGAVGDKYDPRHIVVIAELLTGLVIIALGLALLIGNVEPWHVLVVTFIASALQHFSIPVRNAIYPLLVKRSDIGSAVTLVELGWTGMRIIAPAGAGIIIGRVNIEAAIFVSGGCFLLLSAVATTFDIPKIQRSTGSLLKETLAGIMYLKDHPVLLTIAFTFLMTGFFGAPYVFIMPVLAVDVLYVGVEEIGWLLGASGMGALSGVFLFAKMGRFRFIGKTLIAGYFLFGTFLILFSVVANAQSYALSMITLFLAELAFSIAGLVGMTAVQTLVTDEYRGRVIGVFVLYFSFFALGGVLVAMLAHYIGAPFAIATGGAVMMCMALVLAFSHTPIRALNYSPDTVAPSRD